MLWLRPASALQIQSARPQPKNAAGTPGPAWRPGDLEKYGHVLVVAVLASPHLVPAQPVFFHSCNVVWAACSTPQNKHVSNTGSQVGKAVHCYAFSSKLLTGHFCCSRMHVSNFWRNSSTLFSRLRLVSLPLGDHSYLVMYTVVRSGHGATQQWWLRAQKAKKERPKTGPNFSRCGETTMIQFSGMVDYFSFLLLFCFTLFPH